MNILEQANEIVFNRSEEKERQYGPFNEGMEKAAQLAQIISGHSFSADDMYIAMIALKLSRQSYNHKTDNLLDCIAYIASWNEYKNKTNNND